MSDQYVLSQQTADQLQQLLGRPTPNRKPDGSAIQNSTVLLCTGPVSGSAGDYTARMQWWNGTAWLTVGDAVLTLRSLSTALVTGSRYVAVADGTKANGVPVWFTDGGDISGGQGGIGNGLIPPLCKTTDAYGVVTYKMAKILADNSLVCLPVPDCCPSRFFCVDNRLLVTAVGACCAATTPVANRFTATRILRVEFRAKTGYAADIECGLPEGIFLVSNDGLTWSGAAGGASFPMRATTFTGGLTVSCVAGVLTATWGMSGFTGGTPTTIACTLTGVAVSLGTFTVALNQCTPCDPTIPAASSTVEVWISSVLNATSDPESPLTVLAGYIPPYLNNGLFKTMAEAENCCPVSMFTMGCCVSPYDKVPGRVKFNLSNKTGYCTCLPDRIIMNLVQGPTAVGNTYLLDITASLGCGQLHSKNAYISLSYLIECSAPSYKHTLGVTIGEPVGLTPAGGIHQHASFSSAISPWSILASSQSQRDFPCNGVYSSIQVGHITVAGDISGIIGEFDLGISYD